MVIVRIKEKEFYIDGYLKKNLDTAKSVIQDDWDMIFVYDGNEGAGKSVKAAQDAFYCYPDLSLDNICFTDKSFLRAIDKAPQYSAVIYDEGYGGLSSRGTMSMINRAIVKKLTEIRQKNLFIFIVLPCFFDLDKYVALWRSRVLIHVYTQDNFKRGFFCFYNADRKKDLYMFGKDRYSYYKPDANFRGRFTKFFPLDMDKYKELKAKATIEGDEESNSKIKVASQKFMFPRVLKLDIPIAEKIRLLQITDTTYYRWKQLLEEGNKIDEIIS